MLALTRILVPTNLGQPSKAAVAYGLALAKVFGAQLFLLHVLAARDYDAAIEAERVIEELEPDIAPGGAQPDVVARTVARVDLQRLLLPEDEAATRAEYLLLPADSGGPHATICRCARELDVELIVMGKHGIGRVDHLLSGSVTEKVLRDAPCPLLIVRSKEHDFVIPALQP